MASTAFISAMRGPLPQPTLEAFTKMLVVGAGRFGAHLKELFQDKAPGIEVDLYTPGPRYIGDGSFPIRQYHIIVLAVPIREYEAVIAEVVSRCHESAIIVDVASVKQHTMQLLKKHAASRYWIATHPMWGPQSYRKTCGDVTNYRLVVTGHTLPKLVYRKLKLLIEQTGIIILSRDSRHHDADLARTLFVAHFFGRVVASAGLQRTEIDTVSFGYLMSMVESVIDDEELFLDVVRYNRQLCSQVLREIEDATHKVRLLITGASA